MMGFHATIFILAVVSSSTTSLRMIPACQNCRPNQRCVKTNIVCVTTPCPTHKCVDVVTTMTPLAVAEKKPGLCPKPPSGMMGICVVNCKNDASCPRDQKCCGSCPKECKTPIKIAKPVTKPGVCPPEASGMFGACVVKCTGDVSCPDNQKCCGSCPKVCKTPIKIAKPITKPGACPPEAGGMFGACVVKCRGDASCPDNQKCCGNCPKMCKKPVYVNSPINKRGICPKEPEGFVGACVAKCENDRDCPDEKKCCGNCPKECKIPIINFPKKEKLGMCPKNKEEMFSSNCVIKCRDDSNCMGMQKCCGNCSKNCVDPVIRPAVTLFQKFTTVEKINTSTVDIKHTQCPTLPVNKKCKRRCTSDGDCERMQKCCRGCCFKPGSLKQDRRQGMCPKIFQTSANLKTEKCDSGCKTDEECETDKICCGRCPKVCMTPGEAQRAVAQKWIVLTLIALLLFDYVY